MVVAFIKVEMGRFIADRYAFLRVKMVVINPDKYIFEPQKNLHVMIKKTGLHNHGLLLKQGSLSN